MERSGPDAPDGESGNAALVSFPGNGMRSDTLASDPVTRRRLVLAVAGLAFAGLAAATLNLTVAEADWAGSILLLITVAGVVLVPFSMSLAFLYMALAGPLVITLNQHAGAWGPGKLALYLFVLISLLMAAAGWQSRRPARTFLAPAGFLLLTFAVYLGGHVLAAEDRAAAFETFVSHLYHWPLLLVPAFVLRESWQPRVVLHFFAGLGALLAVAAVGLTLLAAGPVESLSAGGSYHRVHLYFGTANSLGVFLSLTFFVVFHAASPERRVWRWLRFAAAAVMIVALVLTFSRRSWLATGVVLGFHFVRRLDWRGLILAAAVAVVLLSGPLGQVEERAETIVDVDDPTNLERKQEVLKQLLWLPGADEVSWLGWGLERAAGADDVEGAGRSAVYFHSYYLTLYYLGGAVGVILYLAVVGATFAGLWRALRRSRAPATRGALSAGMSCMVVVLIQGLFGTGNMTFPVNYMTALIPGLALALYAQERADAEATGSSREGEASPGNRRHCAR